MAKCERREIRPEPPPVEFVLTLTAREAAYLMRRIRTTPTICDDSASNIAIWDALRSVGADL